VLIYVYIYIYIYRTSSDFFASVGLVFVFVCLSRRQIQPECKVDLEGFFARSVRVQRRKCRRHGCCTGRRCSGSGFAAATIMDSRRRQNNCVIAFSGDRAFVSRAPLVIILRPSIIRSRDRPAGRSAACHSPARAPFTLPASVSPPCISLRPSVRLSVRRFVSFCSPLSFWRLRKIRSCTRVVVVGRSEPPSRARTDANTR